MADDPAAGAFEKFGQHEPLNRQAERYALEGVELSLSTLTSQLGAVNETLKPLHALIEALCWRHAHRKVFELADIEGYPRSAAAPRRRSGMASPTFGF